MDQSAFNRTPLIRDVHKRFRLFAAQSPPPGDVIRNDVDALAFDELLRLLAIRAVRDGDRVDGFTVGMRSGPADDLWHRWLLWTGHYAKACQFAAGHMVHHAANPAGMDPDEWLARHFRFREAYEECWGPVPPTTWGSVEGLMDEHSQMQVARRLS